MPSRSSPPLAPAAPGSRPTVRSLRGRVALATALVAAAAGLGSAGGAALLVAELEGRSQDARLLDTAALMQRELDTGGDPRKHVDDEALEIGPLGLRMALFEGGVRRAGALDVALPAGEGCTSRIDATGEWRACAVGEAARRVVVTTRRDGQHDRGGALLLAVLAAALLSAIVSALASRALAGWALAPLTALGERLEQVTSAAPGKADLGPPSGSSEVEALRATIRALLARLGEAMDRSRGFAANAAHELRTPLATMMAELDLASEQAPQVDEALARVRRTTGRLSVLVERLLLLASGTATLSVTEAVAMEDLVRDVVGARAENERARVETTVTSPGMVRGDEALLRIVVDNLVDNALKFSNAGHVYIRVYEQADGVCLVVRDEGPGVDPAEAEHLLLPFARGARTEVAGHGLGLAIVAHAVRLHGGEVRFVPREGGAELLVTLPSWRAEDA